VLAVILLTAGACIFSADASNAEMTNAAQVQAAAFRWGSNGVLDPEPEPDAALEPDIEPEPEPIAEPDAVGVWDPDAEREWGEWSALWENLTVFGIRIPYAFGGFLRWGLLLFGWCRWVGRFLFGWLRF
jgi:hypothetical protein